MKTSELIAQLQALIAEHGDLPILVTGFDSCGFDDAEDPRLVVDVQKIGNPTSHSPGYEHANDAGFSRQPYQRSATYMREGDPFNAIYIG